MRKYFVDIGYTDADGLTHWNISRYECGKSIRDIGSFRTLFVFSSQYDAEKYADLLNA